jgi:Protein of unknown function (DUF3553)
MAEGDFVRESLYDFWGTGYVWGVIWDFLAIEFADEGRLDLLGEDEAGVL